MNDDDQAKPIPSKPKTQATPREIEQFLTEMRIPHRHMPDGSVVPTRNRAERRATGLRGKRWQQS